MPPSPQKRDFTPPFVFRGKIYPLLVEGHSLTNAAKLAGCSIKTAWKWANFYVEKGLLEQTIKYPAMFQKKAEKREILPPHYATPQNGVKSPIKPPLLRPHRVSAILAILGKPNVKRRKAWATFKEYEYTVQIGVDKAILTLNLTQGESPEENLSYARARIPELCGILGKKYGCSLSVLRYLKGVEWCLTDKPASKVMSEEVPIKKTEHIEVAGANFWFDSCSHPKEVQITPAHGNPPEMPTIHAATLYYLLTRLPSDMKNNGELLNKITESIVVVNQKVEMLSELVKKGGKP